MTTDRFFMMPNWFFDDGHLTAMGVNTFTVYMILVRHSNSETHECNPSYSSIQKKAKIGRTAISSAINYLVQHGYIEVIKTGSATQSSSVYRVPPFKEIKGVNQSHIGLVLNKTSPKKQPKPVPYGTRTSPIWDCELVLDRTQNIQTLNIQIEKDKKEKDAETFFSDSINSNQAMQVETSANIAIKEDHAPLPPTPLGEASSELQAKFEGRFSGKANKYEPQGLTTAGFGEWHLGDRYNNWKASLIAVAQKRKRDANQLDTPKAATDYIYNMARDCYREKHWGKFENLISDAVDYEKALAANPTINQDDEPAPMPEYAYDCRLQHFYPNAAKVSKNHGFLAIFWGLENRFPPQPIADRCSKFLQKMNEGYDIAQLLTARHFLEGSVSGYAPQKAAFDEERESLITAFKQEVEKLLSQSQAA